MADTSGLMTWLNPGIRKRVTQKVTLEVGSVPKIEENSIKWTWFLMGKIWKVYWVGRWGKPRQDQKINSTHLKPNSPILPWLYREIVVVDAQSKGHIYFPAGTVRGDLRSKISRSFMDACRQKRTTSSKKHAFYVYMPCTELTYPILGKENSSSKVLWEGICWFPTDFNFNDV